VLCGQQIDRRFYIWCECAVFALLLPKVSELLIGGEFTVPEKIRNRFKRLGLCELLDWIATVQEAVRFRVYFRDRGGVGDNTGEALINGGFLHDRSFAQI